MSLCVYSATAVDSLTTPTSTVPSVPPFEPSCKLQSSRRSQPCASRPVVEGRNRKTHRAVRYTYDVFGDDMRPRQSDLSSQDKLASIQYLGRTRSGKQSQVLSTSLSVFPQQFEKLCTFSQSRQPVDSRFSEYYLDQRVKWESLWDRVYGRLAALQKQ